MLQVLYEGGQSSRAVPSSFDPADTGNPLANAIISTLSGVLLLIQDLDPQYQDLECLEETLSFKKVMEKVRHLCKRYGSLLPAELPERAQFVLDILGMGQ